MEVKFIPCQAHCFSFGGFDLQMIHTLEAVQSIGIEASKLNPWDRNNNFDILHFWGFDLSHYRNIIFGKRNGKKIVMTALSGYVGNYKESLKWVLRNQLRSYKYNKEMIELIDSFVFLNEGQAEFAVKYWRVPEYKISIIPAIIQKNYFEAAKLPLSNYFHNTYGIKDFILTTGSVGTRKNQLKLALACSRINKNLVIIGKGLAGEEIYINQLRNLVKINQSIIWIEEMENNSPVLISAYRECKAFALISHEEQQPISPLEAAVIGKPVLLGNSSYAKQNYFTNAFLVDVNDVKKIENALNDLLRTPEFYTIPENQLNIFRSSEVAEKYSLLYQNLI